MGQDPELVHLHHSSKIKVIKKSQNSRNQGFSYRYYFCLMMEGSGDGSVLVINGSGLRIQEAQKKHTDLDPQH
jgi:hypothetical protein